MMIFKYLILLTTVIITTACMSNFQAGLGERDKFVINTPEFPDNRVYYVDNLTDTEKKHSALLKSIDLYKAYPNADFADKFIKNREPLSVIANSVTFPYSKEEKTKTKDIVVLLDIITDANKISEPIVVWYQRGVYSGQSLNFANLLLFSQSSYDDRIAPFFRIRVVDVQTENNIETRETLSQVSKFGGAAALAFSNPSFNPVFITASKAASLVLANKSNKMLLDYTVQFYPKDIVVGNGNPNLTPFLKGRFLLVGRSKDKLGDDNYWDKINTYDELNLKVSSENPSDNLSPVVTLQVLNKELAVLPVVALRTAYLTKLLNDGAQEHLGEIQNVAEDLSNRLKVFAFIESSRKYHSRSDLESLIEIYSEAEHNNKPLQSDITDQMRRYLNKITGCNFDMDEYSKLFSDDTVVFKKDEEINTDGILLKTEDSSVLCKIASPSPN